MLDGWQTFFATQATVGAALTGLVFVALSINLKPIVEIPGLAGRAGEALVLLMLPVFVGLAGVSPQHSLRALGFEVLGLALLELVVVTRFVLDGRIAARSRPRHEYVIRAGIAEAAVVPNLVAGLALVASHPAGLYWQLVGALLCVTAGVVDAWVLLVEILR